MRGLDVKSTEQIWQMLDEVRTRFDLSILLSTHDFSSLERNVDKVLLLQHTLLCVGTPAEVLASEAFATAFHLRKREGGA